LIVRPLLLGPLPELLFFLHRATLAYRYRHPFLFTTMFLLVSHRATSAAPFSILMFSFPRTAIFSPPFLAFTSFLKSGFFPLPFHWSQDSPEWCLHFLSPTPLPEKFPFQTELVIGMTSRWAEAILFPFSAHSFLGVSTAFPFFRVRRPALYSKTS